MSVYVIWWLPEMYSDVHITSSSRLGGSAPKASCHFFSTRAVDSGASYTLPEGSKVPNHRVFRVSILGIVMMVLGRYLMAEYLDP